MDKKLKVFGGLTMVEGKQLRTIVATTSQKKASKLAGVPLSEVREYWSVTGNGIELAVGLAKPETVFRASTSRGTDFEEEIV